MPVKIEIPIGTKFGKLTTIEKEFRENGETKIKTKCECGREVILRKQYLRKGQSTRCYKCYTEEGRPSRRKGINNLSGGFLGTLKRNAKRRNLEVSVNIHDLYEQYLKQDGKCALSGIDITLDNYKKGSGTGSVDRIDSSKGYTKDNIQWVHKHLNVMKQATTMEDFINWCILIVKYQQNKI